MKILLQLMFPLSLWFYSCHTKTEEAPIEKWKVEILNTEQEFAEVAQQKGIPEAFLMYAAEDAVLMRNNSLIIGKQSMRENFESMKSAPLNQTLSWNPDFVAVASSGDLGYTYGKYTYTTTDSIGNTKVEEGIFHTIWKRQPDGKWRFVWD